VFVLPTKAGVEVVDSDMCQLDSVIDAFQTHGAHGEPLIINSFR
jgi:hypothetical protein